MEKEFNTITIDIKMTKDNEVSNKVYMEIINALNDIILPIDNIKLNGEEVFNSEQGFINKEEK